MKDKNNVATHTKFTGISLCSGIGMLDAGLNLALGGKFRPLLHVEREAFCAANLAWQMEKKFLDEAAEWDDVRTITSAECRDYVRTALGSRKLDFIIGGIPCQPYSHAGKRSGGDDERDLWPSALEAIKVYEPRFVFIENVEGMASHVDGARRLLQDLEVAGYRAKAGLFSSKECGASHGRKRLFFLGNDEGRGVRWIRKEDTEFEKSIGRSDNGMGNAAGERLEGWIKERRTGDIERPVDDVADATQFGKRKQNNEVFAESWKDARRDISGNGLRLADTESSSNGRQRIDNGESGSQDNELEMARGALPRYAPARNDFDAWAAVAEVDAARMPAIESTLRGVADGLANWDLQLHAIGNGVDPLVAAYAFCTLWACMQED